MEFTRNDTAQVLPIGDPAEYLRLAPYLLCVGQHRDSTILEQSNFIVARDWLRQRGANFEVLSFNCFAVGWIEELVVHPAWANVVSEIREALDNYPILDEMHYTEMQHDAAAEAGCIQQDDGTWLHESGEVWSEDSFN